MKYKTIKTAAMAFLALGLVSCADELNIKSIDKKYSTTYNVEELLAKQYGALGLTGQKGLQAMATLPIKKTRAVSTAPCSTCKS